MFVLVPLGFPGFVFYFFRFLHRHHRLWNRVPEGTDGARFNEADRAWYLPDTDSAHDFGFLFLSYEPQYYWWEVKELLKKLFFTGVILLILPGSPEQSMFPLACPPVVCLP